MNTARTDGKIKCRGRNGWFHMESVEVIPPLEGKEGIHTICFYSQRKGIQPPIMIQGTRDSLASLVESIQAQVGKATMPVIMTHEPDLMERARAAARQFLPDRKIHAIKEVRALTGMGLKEAKDFVEAMPECPPVRRD